MSEFKESPRPRKRITCSVIGRLLRITAVGWLLSAVAPAATTEPRGIYVVKVAGTTEGEAQVRTHLGIQLLPGIRFRGEVASVTGNAFSVSFLDSPAQLAEPGRQLYVHVLDGNGRGFISDIVEFRPADFLCADALDSWMSPGSHVLIRPHPTLGELFGADNRFNLGAGTEAAQADNVVVWDPVAQQEKVYYFHSVRNRWEERNSAADATAAILRFPLGCYLIRRSPGTRWLVLSGEVGAESVLLPVRPGANVFSLPVNLSSSLDQWIHSSGDHAVIAGPNANRADLLTFEEPSTGSRSGPFYRASPPGGDTWREVGVDGSTAAATRLDFLSTLTLRRHGGPGFVLANGSLEPGPSSPPAFDPEVPVLTGELPFRAVPELVLTVEISTDLQTWTPHAQVESSPSGKVTFALPAGQTRGFYRLHVSEL